MKALCSGINSLQQQLQNKKKSFQWQFPIVKVLICIYMKAFCFILASKNVHSNLTWNQIILNHEDKSSPKQDLLSLLKMLNVQRVWKCLYFNKVEIWIALTYGLKD